MRKTNLSEPINLFLKNNLKKKPVSFHMPGHKYGRSRGFGLSGSSGLRYDITEINGADNIKDPKGIIKESLDVISSVYGSKRTFFLTNGTTSGIHVILRYASIMKKKLLLSRDCHISAVNGAMLFGTDISFIPTAGKDGIPVPVQEKELIGALDENPDSCGVLITSPNYYGRTADLLKFSELVHERGMFLAVDEAHGAHFNFAGLGELSGIKCGADIVCHSMHKTLPVFNQGALLHICTDGVDERLVKDAVNMLGTTSPSYPLMASMEKAAVHMEADASKIYGRLKKGLKYFLKHTKHEIIQADDYTRLVIKTPGNGFETASILHDEYAIDIEESGLNHIVCITTPANTKREFRQLAKALGEIGDSGGLQQNEMGFPALPERLMTPAEAYSKNMESVPLDMAEGRICGTIIVPYPPGTPIICPGEIINGYAIEYIKKLSAAGGSILGLDKNKIPVLEQT